MKKLFTVAMSLVLFLTLAVAPVYAAGGKNRGSVGQGTVDQGESSEQDTGDNAQGNQAP